MGRITPLDPNSSQNPHGQYGIDWAWQVLLDSTASLPQMIPSWSKLPGIYLSAERARLWGAELTRLADFIEETTGSTLLEAMDAINRPKDLSGMDAIPPMRVYGAIEAPKKAGDAGYDIASSEDRVIAPGALAAIQTNVVLEMPAGMCGVIIGRSSLNVRGILSQVGLVDSGYRGYITVALHNVTSESVTIRAGDRIAQLVFLPAFTPTLIYVSDPSAFTSSERGADGFGSTGK